MTASTPRRPTLSVVMPVLNPHPEYFVAAVQSVLRQGFADWELIIVEDPSATCAPQLLAGVHDPRIRYIRNELRTSFAEQLNRGIAKAQADVIARMDADDVCQVERFHKQLEFLHRHPDVDILGSQLVFIDDHGRPLGHRRYPRSHAAVIRALPRYSALAHPSVVMKRRALLSVGGYRKCLHGGAEDYDLWSRLAARGARFANHPEELLQYRIHHGQMKSTQLTELIRATLEVKDLHWAARMDLRAQLRKWGERLLLAFPPKLVLAFFMTTHCR
jgi:glycosyltransferase involved in cell wall biosynthesis